MSNDPVAIEKQLDTKDSQSRSAGKGPFILAKVIVSYLSKKKQVGTQDVEITFNRLIIPQTGIAVYVLYFSAIKNVS